MLLIWHLGGQLDRREGGKKRKRERGGWDRGTPRNREWQAKQREM